MMSRKPLTWEKAPLHHPPIISPHLTMMMIDTSLIETREKTTTKTYSLQGNIGELREELYDSLGRTPNHY
jgi:hypothetical protein